MHLGYAKFAGILASLVMFTSCGGAIAAGPAMLIDSAKIPDARQAQSVDTVKVDKSALDQQILDSEIRQESLVLEASGLVAEERSILDSVPYQPIPGEFRAEMPVSTACSLDTQSDTVNSITTIEVELAPVSKASVTLNSSGTDILFFAVLCGNRYVAWSKISAQPIPITESEARSLLQAEILLHDTTTKYQQLSREIQEETAILGELESQVASPSTLAQDN
jgi:hypothetical protein